MKMKRRKRNTQSWWGDERGVALVAAILTVVVLTILGLGIIGFSTTDSVNTARMGRDLQALYAADAGVENVVKQLWADYVAQDCSACAFPKDPGAIGNLNTYVAFLDGVTNAQGDPLVDGGPAWNADVNPLPPGGATIQQVTAIRTDDANGVTVAVTSLGSTSDKQVTVQEMIRVQGTLFKGFEYGLFADNVNCIMCHAKFDNAERYYNTDKSKEGTFDRIKVATLETLQIRPDGANSVIAGTLYTVGALQDDGGSPLADLTLTTLDGYQFDANGKIVQGGGGAMTQVDLTKATGSPLPPLENLYVDYPTDPAGQVDGELPTSFPMPYPDDDSDRIVDDSEFATAAGKATGAITGGILYGVPSGSSYSGSGLPSSSSADLSGGLSKSYSGNVVLVGTDANPITCNGDVAVDGDVIISGKVKGECSIMAKGNIYVMGDTTYADATSGGKRTFGVAADGTKNGLALVSGKNVIMGDYLTASGQSLTDPTQVDPGGQVGPPVWDPGDGTPGDGQWIYSKSTFTQSELTLFNKAQYEKAQADPYYTPRYYQLRDGDPIYRWTGTGEKGKEYNSEFTAFTPNPGDAVISLSPMGATPWISETQLKEIWVADNAARPPKTPFQVDGLLYSSNAIFALARTAGNKKGQMILNGAIVAPDMGILVPGFDTGVKDAKGNKIKETGLQLNYDRRVSSLVKLADPGSQVTLVRRAWTMK